jgi:hypothetical protein
MINDFIQLEHPYEALKTKSKLNKVGTKQYIKAENPTKIVKLHLLSE